MGLQWAYLNNNQKRENRPRATGKRGDPQHHPSPVRLQPFLNLHSGGGPWMWCTQPWVFSLQTCGWEVYQKENMYNSDYINAQKNYIIIAYYTVDILSAHSHNHIGLDRCWNMHVFCTRFLCHFTDVCATFTHVFNVFAEVYYQWVQGWKKLSHFLVVCANVTRKPAIVQAKPIEQNRSWRFPGVTTPAKRRSTTKAMTFQADLMYVLMCQYIIFLQKRVVCNYKLPCSIPAGYMRLSEIGLPYIYWWM